MDTVNNHLDCRAQFKYNSIFTTSAGCVICSAIFSLLYPDATCQPETHGATSRGSRVDHGGECSPNTANQFFFSFLFWLLSTVHSSTVQTFLVKFRTLSVHVRPAPCSTASAPQSTPRFARQLARMLDPSGDGKDAPAMRLMLSVTGYGGYTYHLSRALSHILQHYRDRVRISSLLPRWIGPSRV